MDLVKAKVKVLPVPVNLSGATPDSLVSASRVCWFIYVFLNTKIILR